MAKIGADRTVVLPERATTCLIKAKHPHQQHQRTANAKAHSLHQQRSVDDAAFVGNSSAAITFAPLPARH
jgi:hypothetical protein